MLLYELSVVLSMLLYELSVVLAVDAFVLALRPNRWKQEVEAVAQFQFGSLARMVADLLFPVVM
jgi:hypothetical protein